MQYYNLFFLVCISTIIVSRLFLYVWKINSRDVLRVPPIKGFHIHHYVFGIFFFALSLLWSFGVIKILFSAIGVGLFVDEIPLLFYGGPLFFFGSWTYADYNTWLCRIGVVFLTSLIFIFRTHFIFW